jgi:hypothetical protein
MKKNHFYFSDIVKWILSVCLNIHTLELDLPNQSNGLHNEIVRLKKLKNLYVYGYGSFQIAYLKEVYLCYNISRFLKYDNAAHFLVDCKELPPGGDTSIRRF